MKRKAGREAGATATPVETSLVSEPVLEAGVAVDKPGDIRMRARALLQAALGENAQFRPGQLEAVFEVAQKRGRALVVQRTGWGKSVVYFIATKLLRESGQGVTILISPLISLMRDQRRLAASLGVQADTINSSNSSEWDAINSRLADGKLDLLLVSPERLAYKTFRDRLEAIRPRPGMLVIDEAHCISDWGHDFRPDYRRIIQMVERLPGGTPLLATTATANDRVIADVKTQLGESLTVYRGGLGRDSLHLQVMPPADPAERMAWLAAAVPQLPGSGIIYCLTVRDVRRVSEWLRQNGIAAEGYHAAEDGEVDREKLEKLLHDNRVKVLVATVALGMGFDKPDLAFVIHFQSPGSVIAYYQQVGRAGRAIDKAVVVLQRGSEDRRIIEYFIESATPSPAAFRQVLDAIEGDTAMMSGIRARCNLTNGVIKQCLKILAVEGVVEVWGPIANERVKKTGKPWQYDEGRVNRLKELRYKELEQMEAYAAHQGCLMQFLMAALDDKNPERCGRCQNCQGKPSFMVAVDPGLVNKAEQFLAREVIEIPVKERLPKGLVEDPEIPGGAQNSEGRSLCHYADGRWGRMVQEGKYRDGRFVDELVSESRRLIREKWKPSPAPRWVTAIPSARHPKLVPDFAKRLAEALGLPFKQVLERSASVLEQKTMQNGYHQAKNVAESLRLTQKVDREPVLLVDDIMDSGWTLTIAGKLLREGGCPAVHPFTLARASMRRSYT